MTTQEEILHIIDSIKDLNILIIGETIIDEYQYGYTLGKSGKFPIVSFQNEYSESYDGGVLAIRNHLKDFCKVDILTGWKKIVKKRYIQNGQKLFETYSHKEDLGYNESENLNSYDLVIVADFGHGFIDRNMINNIESESNYISLNAQHNSGNMGMNTINKYSKWNYASIDDIELRLACSNQFDDIKKLISERFNGTDKVISVTENKYGSIVYKNNKIIEVPAYAKEIVDTVGAGDAYLALTSPLAYLDASAELIGCIGNIAGAIACSYPGNKEYVSKEKMLRFVKERF